MGIALATIFEIKSTATTANVNGAGFNPTNANGITDLGTDPNTANTASPVVSSAAYNFQATDVGHWLYVKSGTNWQAGWYQIASVSVNKATLSAAIGAAVIGIDAKGVVTRNTAAGCTSNGTATLSNGVYMIDYSQGDTAINTNTDITCTAASTTVTSASAPFLLTMPGNIIHLTALTGTGAITGWYEIVSVGGGTTAVLDRTPTNGVNNITAGTFFIGGAGRLNGLEDAFGEMIPAGGIIFVKSGTYTFSATYSIASTNSSATTPSYYRGYNSIRGDVCTGANRPVFAMGTLGFTCGQYMMMYNLSITGTAASLVSMGTGINMVNCKVVNSSTTASRSAISNGTTNVSLIDCEFTSQNGIGVTANTNSISLTGCYIHDCVTGINGSAINIMLLSNLIESCQTAAVTLSSTLGGHFIHSNTFYGSEAKVGIGLNLTGVSSSNNQVTDNIIYGFATGIAVSTGPANSNFSYYNNFFNNTADVSNWLKSPTELALNPGFNNASQITGSTATTSASTLTQSGGDFTNVTDNVDYVRVVSGTGVTTGIYLITSHTTTTLTVNNALGTSGGGDVVYVVPTGHDFTPGINMKGVGFPVANIAGIESTSYPDIGFIQRQETGGVFWFDG